jgi:hypothetical protein
MPAPYSVFHRLVVSVSCSHMRCPVGALRKPVLPRAPAAPSASTTTHLFNDNYFSSWATIKPSPNRDRPSSKPAAAGPGRSEHRNVDILIPVARQRESPAGPNVPCERRTDPAEPPPRHGSPAPAPPLRHRITGQSTRGYAAFLQNAPVVYRTRGFTPGWYRGRDGRCRPPLPPNRTGGFPASGSPVGESPACGGTGAIGTG